MSLEKTGTLHMLRQSRQKIADFHMDKPKLRALAKLVGLEAGAAMLGMLLARGDFAGGAFEAAAPFAIALAAAGSVRFLGMEVLGVAAGSLLFLPYPQCVTVMACAAAAGLLNLACRKFGFRRSLAASVCAFGCSAVSGFLSLIALPENGVTVWVYALCGAVFAGCAAYFLTLAQGVRRVKLVEDIHDSDKSATARHTFLSHKYYVNRRQRVAMLFCAGAVFASLGGLALGQFSPAHVPGVLLVLAAAWCWRETGGAVAGICVGTAFLLAGSDARLTAVYALGGLLAGVFGRIQSKNVPAKSKAHALLNVPAAGGFALVCVYYVALEGASEADPAGTVTFALECLAAIAMFVAIPTKAWNRLRDLAAEPDALYFVPPEAQLRLNQTASALRKVGEYVSEVSEGLEKLNAPAEQSIAAAAREAACGNCPSQSYCHEEHAQRSAAFFERTRTELRRGDLSQERFAQLRLESGLALPCQNAETLRRAFLRAYDAYCARETCHQSETQLRRVAAAQFGTISTLMEELGTQLTTQTVFESEIAQAAQQVLEINGYRTQNLCCLRGPDHAVQLTAAVRPSKSPAPKDSLTRALRHATGIPFCPSESVPAEDGGVLLTFLQQPAYQFTTGAVQMSSSGSEYCGDYFDCFSDGNGNELLVISDGMGTGGRAAVDSALAAEIFGTLVRSGLPCAGAVSIVNQALLLKSCEETLSTIDSARINLYTGDATFCKAGGASSFLRHSEHANLPQSVEKIELSALPAGILQNIRPAEASATLAPGDILVMVSDGMLCSEDAWLSEALASWDSTNMQALAEHLADLAVQKRSGSTREDDLTVLCGMLSFSAD